MEYKVIDENTVVVNGIYYHAEKRYDKMNCKKCVLNKILKFEDCFFIPCTPIERRDSQYVIFK